MYTFLWNYSTTHATLLLLIRPTCHPRCHNNFPFTYFQFGFSTIPRLQILTFSPWNPQWLLHVMWFRQILFVFTATVTESISTDQRWGHACGLSSSSRWNLLLVTICTTSGPCCCIGISSCRILKGEFLLPLHMKTCTFKWLVHECMYVKVMHNGDSMSIESVML